jgi:hypothetical protein
MRRVRTSLFLVGIVIAYCLIATLLNWEAARSDISKVILLAILVFIWCMAHDPNRKYFS